MKGNLLARLARGLLPDLPGASAKGPMALVCPIGPVLRGVCLDGSGLDRQSFYVWLFALPMFVPTRHLYFNLGERLRAPGGGDRWSSEWPDVATVLGAQVRREAPPFLHDMASPARLAEGAGRFAPRRDPYVQQAIAYAWVYVGEFRRAECEFRQLLSLLRTDIPWQMEMAERARCLLSGMRDRPAGLAEQFSTWEAENVRSLELDGFPAGR